MDKPKYVFSFTNENVASFNSLYNFNNANVLSVLGSGDQYFSSLLYGAKDIELYDINESTWDFFLLKYYGIMIFSYEEFYNYFIVKKFDDLKNFKRIISYLPQDVANRLSNLYQKHNGLSPLLFSDDYTFFEVGDYIPYLNREKYYQLQSLLLNRSLPTFYLTNLKNLPYQVSNRSYDIILTSNIFDWMYHPNPNEQSIIEYKELLNKFKYSEIQALYGWKLSKFLEIKFQDNGFDIARVPSSVRDEDIVVSLRRKFR